MTLDWKHFTPWASLTGGLLIGLATALYLLGTGRIAGIVASPLRAFVAEGKMAPEQLPLLFNAWLLVAPHLWRLFAPLPATTVDV